MGQIRVISQNGAYLMARSIIQTFFEDIRANKNVDRVIIALESERNKEWFDIVCCLAKMDSKTVRDELDKEIAELFDKRQ